MQLGPMRTGPMPPERTRRLRARAGAAAVGLVVLISPGAAVAQTAAPSASATHQVPPAAPTPTSSGNSPDAPDPDPPAGGIGPDGEDVGGAALQSRGLVAPAGAPALPSDVDARAWALVDLTAGTVLAGQDVHGRYQPASILKLLTAVTVLPSLPGDRVVTVSKNAATTEGSRAGLLTDGTYTIDNLFSGLLLVSGNDTAVALAEAYGGIDKTVAAMNAEALKLGAYDTFVQTPSGLDGWQQLTSAYDMSLVLRAALAQPRFVAYDEEQTATLPAQHADGVAIDPVQLTNQTDNFLTEVPGALFAKIGYTDAAQHTYVAAATRNGRTLGVVLLRAQKYPVDQWQQAASLLNWGYALPPGTAPVGTLDSAVATAVATPATSDPASTGPRRGTSSVLGTSRGHGGGLSTGTEIALLITLAALVTVAALVRRRLRSPRGHPQASAADRLRRTQVTAPAPAIAPTPSSVAATPAGDTGDS